MVQKSVGNQSKISRKSVENQSKVAPPPEQPARPSSQGPAETGCGASGILQNSSFLIQNSSFLIQNASFLLTRRRRRRRRSGLDPLLLQWPGCSTRPVLRRHCRTPPVHPGCCLPLLVVPAISFERSINRRHVYTRQKASNTYLFAKLVSSPEPSLIWAKGFGAPAASAGRFAPLIRKSSFLVQKSSLLMQRSSF